MRLSRRALCAYLGGGVTIPFAGCQSDRAGSHSATATSNPHLKELDPDPRFDRVFTTGTIKARLGAHALNDDLVIDSEGNVYRDTDDKWKKIQKIEVSGAPEYDGFPLVSEGDTVYTADTEDEGTIYVYKNREGRLEERVERSDEIIGWSYDQTGSKLAASDDTILAGSIPSTPNESTKGAITTYRKSGRRWRILDSFRTYIEEKEILLKGKTAVVLDQSRQLRVRNLDEDWQHTLDFESDVESMALVSPHELLVGIPSTNAGGEVRIYNLGSAEATHGQTLTIRGSGSRQRFGADVAVSGSTLLVGAPQDDTSRKRKTSDRRTDRGAGYLFVKKGDEWRPKSRILPEDPLEGGHYGYVVSLSRRFGSLAQSGDEDARLHVSPLQALKA